MGSASAFYPNGVLADDFFQPKDLFWTVIGALIGGVIGWVISLRFYQRSRTDTRRDMQQSAQQLSETARRSVRRAALALYKAAHTASEAQLEKARSELQAARGDLVRTGQDALVDRADDAIEVVASWMDDGAPAAQRQSLITEIQQLMTAAGGKGSQLAAVNMTL